MIGHTSFGQIRLTGAISIIGILLSGCLAKEETQWANINAAPDDSSPTQDPPPQDPPPQDPPPTADNSPPQIFGTAGDTAVVGIGYVFSPSASDPDGDTLIFSVSGLPSWSTFDSISGAIGGTPDAGDIGVYRDIVIDVSDGTDVASLDAFTVTVNATGSASVLLSWTPPTENEDGSSLTDLAAYKIYWGATGNNYSSSVTIDNPSVSTYLIENLIPGTYQFVATSINSSGMESAYSNAISRTAM